MPDDLIDLPLGEDDPEASFPTYDDTPGPEVGVRRPRRRPRQRRRLRKPAWPWLLVGGLLLALLVWLFLQPPRLELSPTELPTVKAAVGDSSEPIEIEVHNPGRRRVEINDIRVTGDGGFSIGRRDCSEEIAARETCRVQVVLLPRAMGATTTELEVVGSQRGGTTTLTIDGEGLGANLVAADTAVDFGATTVDGQSSAQTLRVTNRGTLDGPVGEVSIDSNEFRVVGNRCRAPLEPGESCDIEVVFRPRGLGERQATLNASSDVAQPLAGVRLHGRGTGPGFEIRPARLNFGERKVGTASPAEEVVWVNQGDGAWTVDSPRLDGDGFRLVSDTCGRSPVPVRGSCSARVAFAPASAGEATGILTLVHDDGERFPPAELVGTGTAARLDFDLRRVGFPETPVGRTSPPRALRLTNAGSAAADRLAIGIDGRGATSFRLSHDCTSTLDVDATCVLRLSLAPREAGEASATLRVDSDAPESPLTLPLVGNGASPRMSLTRDRLDFATVPQGEAQELQLAVENPGSAALEVTAIAVEGEGFAISGDDCSGRMVVAGGDCAVQVRFQPTRQGAHVGAVEVRSAAGNGRVALSGLAAPPPTPRVGIDPGSLQFDSTRPGIRSPAETITVISHGPGGLSIRSVDLEGDGADSFRLVPGTCDLGRLVAGGSCSIGVRFQPASAGSHRATVAVRSNGDPAVLRVAVSGETIP